MTGLLREAGFEVREAENGEEAIEQFQAVATPLHLDGHAHAGDGRLRGHAAIRALPGWRWVKIVAITASAFKEQRQEILAAGCDEVVHKPFQAHEIFETMARLLDIKYLYKDMGEEVADTRREINLTAEMLTELPPDLLQELRETTMALDREAIFVIIERIEPLSPNTARGLQNAYG